ncbi:hypothetical protein TRV_06803 [Trichophyton verrucosum HKI 0517]|uniref:Uncharacterized protein n=1 Tax=Trichophyton verrucosum (strain HKI 0517) TaxID=663202 RepID=D4DHZ6_TRIVH|nr:uncharacterized protein TRV_06803 [Trichophyton verrucosum HKI 0517]EFE38552.1 hypothetical protein TRV_06803 [Trichophyton verrucosum HKI 0517]
MLSVKGLNSFVKLELWQGAGDRPETRQFGCDRAWELLERMEAEPVDGYTGKQRERVDGREHCQRPQRVEQRQTLDEPEGSEQAGGREGVDGGHGGRMALPLAAQEELPVREQAGSGSEAQHRRRRRQHGQIAVCLSCWSVAG